MYCLLRKLPMLLKQKTNSLFYGKWPYKISCSVIGAHLIRAYGSSGLKHPEIIRGYNFDDQKIIRFINEAKEILQDSNIKRRINHHHIDFYVMTKDEYVNLQLKLKKYITSITEPENQEQLNTLLENKKYVLCDKLPHNTYRYKITFKDMPVKVRNDLIAWAERYDNNDIYVPKSTRNHFKSIKYHYGTHYFYIKDPKMITLVAMAASGYVRRTDEYVVRNSINTESNQELLCQL